MQDSLSSDYMGVPIVKVKITNQSSGENIVLDPFEFVKAHAVLNDELSFLTGALNAGNDYYAPDFHEPVTLFFDHSFQLGTAIFFIEYLIYMFPSEDGDIEVNISNVVSPHQDVGKLKLYGPLWLTKMTKIAMVKLSKFLIQANLLGNHGPTEFKLNMQLIYSKCLVRLTVSTSSTGKHLQRNALRSIPCHQHLITHTYITLIVWTKLS